MRAAARLGWRVAAVVAFGATAALAVTLTRGAPMHAALTSARSHDAAPRCAASGLRVSLGAVPAAATGVRQGLTSYALDFTNVSDVKCELRGYPAVAAYLGSGVQVGNAAAADTTTTAHRVVLAPGETARAAVITSAALGLGVRRRLPGGPRDGTARYPARRVGRPLHQAQPGGVFRRGPAGAGLPARQGHPAVPGGREAGLLRPAGQPAADPLPRGAHRAAEKPPRRGHPGGGRHGRAGAGVRPDQIAAPGGYSGGRPIRSWQGRGQWES